MNDMFGEFLTDDRYEAAAKELMDTYGVHKGHPFYEMFHGASMYQAAELLSYMGVEIERARELMEELVGSVGNG